VPEPGDGLLCALGLVVMFFLVARHRQTPT
jgi:hypothetical protein